MNEPKINETTNVDCEVYVVETGKTLFKSTVKWAWDWLQSNTVFDNDTKTWVTKNTNERLKVRSCNE